MATTHAEIIHIETSSDIRRRQQLEALQKECSFWQKTAEDLQFLMEKIYDMIERDGCVVLSHRNKSVKLVVEQPESKP